MPFKEFFETMIKRVVFADTNESKLDTYVLD